MSDMQTLKYETVIIGSGFAGRSVAAHLKEGSYVILERGEDRDYSDVVKRYLAQRSQGQSMLNAEAIAYQSDRPWNESGPLSAFNYSRYSYLRGGQSNWWGGKATRFTDEIFACDEGLPWAISAREMAPWYEMAERRLGVSGDPTYAHAPPISAIEGAAHWRSAFAPYLDLSHVNNVALNKSGQATKTGQGACIGRAHCAVCKEDAKARPDNVYHEHNTIYDAYVYEIKFEGSRAVAVEVYDGRQVFRVEFDRLVIAANGIETPRLLARSELPGGVNRGSLGRFYQDHAHLEFDCWIPKPLPYGALGGLSHVQLKELSKIYPTEIGGIETSAYALTHEAGRSAWLAAARPDVLADHGLQAFRQDLQGVFRVYIELETLAQIDVQVDLESEIPVVRDEGYAKLIPLYDRIANDMVQTLEARGIRVLKRHEHYRRGYGGHHFAGTTNWSRSEHNMMEADCRLGGTDNVYISGASVIPRAGGIGPTLTLVALAERLGTHLAAS